MLKFNFLHSSEITEEQKLGFEIAALIWGKFLQDDVTINIGTQMSSTMEENVIGGAVPVMHSQDYGVYRKYLENDITSTSDQTLINHQQQGNTVDFISDDEQIGLNSDILLTSAQAKALGMDKALVLDDGTTWTRNLVNPMAIDGYIQLNENFNWSYDYDRSEPAAAGTIDFLSVIFHEIGHILGFVSGKDYTIEQEILYSGRGKISNFTALDLLRFSNNSNIADLSGNQFSIDGGQTNLGTFTQGVDEDGFQASHWEWSDNPLGVMDPNLRYQERAEISALDVQAMDVLGWDVNPTALWQDVDGDGDLDWTLDLAALQQQAENNQGSTSNNSNNNTTENTQTADNNTTENTQTADNNSTENTQTADNNSTENTQTADNNSTENTQTADNNTTDNSQTADNNTTDNSQTADNNTTDNSQTADNNTTDNSQTADNNTTDNSQTADNNTTQNTQTADNNTTQNTQTGITDFQTWWLENSKHGDQKMGNRGEFKKLWQATYNWWFTSGESGEVWWEELYHWWFGSGGSGNDYWQDFVQDAYHWWFGSGGGGNDYWWWFGSGGGGNDYWQTVSWWQEVSYDSNNIPHDQLPGHLGHQNNNSINVILGGAQDDIFGGNLEADEYNGGDGEDLIDGAEGNDILRGDAGYDTIFGAVGDDLIYGGADDDQISGEAGKDALYGEAGADVLFGGDDDDFLSGGEGKDFLVAGVGDDVAMGGAGDDAIEGEAGIDLLVGDDGQDIIGGGSGDDMIFGDSYSESSVSQFINNSRINNIRNLFDIDDHGNVGSNTSSNNSNSSDSTSSNENNVVLDSIIRIEAEDMTITGDYNTENQSFASGGSLIRTYSQGSASTTFSGTSGYYDIIIAYYDENDGYAQVTATLGNTLLDTWSFDKNLSSNLPTVNNFVTKTIANGIMVNAGEVFEIQGIAHIFEYTRIDYVEFVPVAPPSDNSGTNNSDTTNSGTTNSNSTVSLLRIEAEEMNLSEGYYIDTSVFSGTIRTDSYNSPSIATTSFTGASGFYQVVVRYVDESDGSSTVSVNIGALTVDWVFDQNTGNSGYSTYTVTEGLYINTNDAISIQGTAENGEKARIDYIEFIPVESPNLQLSNNSDVLRGGAGNDVIFGDLGKDIIYGEDEFYDGSVNPLILEGYTYYTYGQSTYILSQAGSWEEAQAEARNFGGNLVTINDEAEEDWLQTTFGTKEHLWIGFTDSEQEGVWKWTSGENITYTNWHPSQPNNVGNEDYAILNRYGNGLWNDEKNSVDRRGIIEIDWSVAGGNDVLVGGDDTDTIYGNSGNDAIYGDDIPTLKTPETLTFQQGVSGYSGTLDTFIRSNSRNTDRSGTTYLDVDGNNNNDDDDDDDQLIVQSLIRFEDIFGSQAGQIALDDTINSAVLEVDVYDPGSSFEVYELLQNWTDSATWNSWGNGIQANGVEAASTPVAITGSVSKGILSIDVTTSLQAWQANPNSNYGWALLSTGTNDVDFHSAEGSNPPRLVIDVNQDFNTGLVGHWTFDETSGTQAIDATGSHNGTLTNFSNNNSQWVSGKVGNALDFDGYNDKVVISDAPELDITNKITLAAWINVEDFDNWQGIITKGTGDIPYAMDLQADGSLSFTANYSISGGVGSGDWLSNTKLTTNQWHHVAITYDGNAIRFYIDGQLDSNVVSTNITFATTSQSLVLGANLNGSHFDGSIDDARIYNRALSDADITELFEYQGSTGNNNTISQFSGNDTLTGGNGNDMLNGGTGDDILNGTDIYSVGYFERDILTGGGGADRFILGDTTQAYYATAGSQDYAVINDFNPNEDVVQLYGALNDYQTQLKDGDVWLSRNGDLVAIFEAVTSLDITGSGFEYVNPVV